MKQKVFFILALLLGILVPQGAKAYDFSAVAPTGQTLYYNISGSTVEVTYPSSSHDYSGYTEPSGDLEIPSSVTHNGTTYTVTSIGEGAFYGCSSLTSVTIGNSVTSIGGGAFKNCSSLTSVTIPNSVTSIGSSAFSGCTGLTNVTLGNSVTNIGNYAFCGCDGLTSITIPGPVTSIGNNAFQDCTGLTSLNYNADSCGRFGFSIYNTVHWLQGCSALTTLNIGNGVRIIPDYAFIGCTGLTSVTIPNSVTNIGWKAFSGCTGLTTLNYNADSCSGDGFLTENGSTCSWLSGDTNLTTINIGDSVRIIPDDAFSNCFGLTSVTIPNSVTSIGEGAFDNCFGLTSVTIPNSVTSIGASAFEDCTGLTSVTIPNSVTSIGDAAFRDCSGLTSVTIPNSVTSIGNWAFSGCSGLPSVTIPNSVTSIGNYAFANCSSLTTLDFNADSCTFVAWTWLYYCSALTTLNIGNNVRVIPEYAFSAETFSGCRGLSGTLTIPNSVTSIGNYAFYQCIGLTGVTIPNSVTSIGSYAFESCTGLTGTLTIPNSVTSIGERAFAWCSGLVRVVVGNGVDSIQSVTFKGCDNLQVLYLSSSLHYVGRQAFYDCDHLDTIYSCNPTPPTVENADAFENVWKGLPLIVPAGSRSAYASAYAWREFTNIQEGTLPQGIEDAVYDGVSMKSVDGRIVIAGADGHGVTLNDIQGRTLYHGIATEQLTIDVPATGVYLLQVDDRPAKRIAVVR